MGLPPTKALLATSTSDIDVAHHALTDPGRIVTFDHFTHEFMPGDARKRIIAFDQLEVGAANPR
jgi:hypothetical protein